VKKILIDKNGTPHMWDTDTTKNSPLGPREVVAQKLCLVEPRFYVLASKSGDLFNPYEPGISINKKDIQGIDRFYYILRKCSFRCYESYTVFLRSKNRTHLILSQRSFLDGLTHNSIHWQTQRISKPKLFAPKIIGQLGRHKGTTSNR